MFAWCLPFWTNAVTCVAIFYVFLYYFNMVGYDSIWFCLGPYITWWCIAYTLQVKTLSCGFQPGRPWGSSPNTPQTLDNSWGAYPPHDWHWWDGAKAWQRQNLVLVFFFLWYPNGKIGRVFWKIPVDCYVDINCGALSSLYMFVGHCLPNCLLVNSSSIIVTDVLQLVQHGHSC